MNAPEPSSQEAAGGDLRASQDQLGATVADQSAPGRPAPVGATTAGADELARSEDATLGAGVEETGEPLLHGPAPDHPGTPTPKPRPMPDIPGYQIEGELGRGAMGVVYLARQVRLNRPCALKVILAGVHADPVATVRFLAEAEAVAKLQHPNIVQIHAMGEADGLPFLELEYLPGDSLARGLDGTPWPARRAAALVEALARGVAEAHRLGVIHRDLKPGNILIAADGTPRIADFGLAKSLGAESGLTATESILGTPSYMAPEQAEGKTRQVGPLADVYALGVILYELLVGRPPFRGTAILETLEQVKTAEPVPPSRLVPGLSRDAETIALKCLQKDPAKRYPSAEALAEDLQRFLEDRPIRARRVSSAERMLRWGRRNKLAAGLLAGLLATLFAGFIVSTSQWMRAEANAEELARQLYTSDMGEIQRLDDAGDVGRMGMLLRRHIRRPGKTDWRGFEWYVFWRRYQSAQPLRTLALSDLVGSLTATPNGPTVATWVDDLPGDQVRVILWDAVTGGEPRTFKGTKAQFQGALALSPDGSAFATGSKFDALGHDGFFVNIWNAATGKLLRSLGGPAGHTNQVTALSFSSDGKTLISGSLDTTIKLWDLEADHVLKTFEGHTALIRGVACSPDGRRIASVGGDLTVRLWDVRSGGPPYTSPRISPVVTSVAFSPDDGRYLALGSYGPGARLWDLTPLPHEPRQIKLQGQPDSMAHSVCFSPDGRYLAASNSNSVRVWVVEGGEAWTTLKGHSNLVSSVAFLDGGRLLASGSGDRTVKLWDLSRAGTEHDILTGHSGGVYSLAFTPDSQTLASGANDGSIKLWDVASGRERPPIEAPDKDHATLGAAGPGMIFGLAIHGQTLADNRGCLWNLETGRLLKGLPADQASSFQVAYSPDGSVLATTPNDGRILLWDAAKRELRRPLAAGDLEIHAVSFSPNGRVLASGGGDRTVKLWDPASGRLFAALDYRFEGHTGIIECIAYSRDGRLLASGGRDGIVKVWDVADPARPALIHTLEGHAGMVRGLAYSPDGKTIASASVDGTLKLWDPITGRERCTLVEHASRVVAVAFSPDGTILASGDSGGTIRLWRR